MSRPSLPLIEESLNCERQLGYCVCCNFFCVFDDNNPIFSSQDSFFEFTSIKTSLSFKFFLNQEEREEKSIMVLFNPGLNNAKNLY